jgi:acyl dehydratase
MNVAHEAAIALGVFVLALVVGAAFFDAFLERRDESVGLVLSWWTGRHPAMVFAFIFFYGFLLAHLFTAK